MSIQDDIDALFASSPSPNKGNRWGSRARSTLEALDGNLASLADPTCTYADITDAEVGKAITPVTPTLGGGPAFRFEGTLPPGLRLDPHTGVISGIPTEDLASQEFSITVIGADGDVVATLDIAISVALVSITYPTIQVANGVLIAAGTYLPTVVPAGTWAAWSATDTLPAGMTIDAVTGEIGGTPSGGASGPTDYTMKATNNVSPTASAEASIEVTA